MVPASPPGSIHRAAGNGDGTGVAAVDACALVAAGGLYRATVYSDGVVVVAAADACGKITAGSIYQATVDGDSTAAADAADAYILVATGWRSLYRR